MTSKQLTHKMTTPASTPTPSTSRTQAATPSSSSTTPLKLSNNFKPQTAVHPSRTMSPRNITSANTSTSNMTPATPTSSREPLNIKLKRRDLPNFSNSTLPTAAFSAPAKPMQKIYDVKNYMDVLPEISVEESSQKINLVSIGKCEKLKKFCHSDFTSNHFFSFSKWLFVSSTLSM